MDHHLCVLLYSKYSPMSNKLITALESCPVNLSTTVGLSPVCVDNNSVREQILTANKIDISTVPCVLIVYRNGGVEKYEGGNAFQWFDETVRKYIPPPQEVSQPVTQPVTRSAPRSVPRSAPRSAPESLNKKQRSSDTEKYYEENYESTEKDYKPTRSESEPTESEPTESEPTESEPTESEPTRSEPTRRKRPSTRLSPKKSLSLHKSSNNTSMEELGISDEEETSNILSRPPVGVRTGPGCYDITSEFGEPQEPNRDASRHMRSSTQPATGKGNDLMATAMAMQKEREKVEAKQPRTVGNIHTNQRPI